MLSRDSIANSITTNKSIVSISGISAIDNNESKSKNREKGVNSLKDTSNVIRIDRNEFLKWNTTNDHTKPTNRYQGDLKIILEMTSILMRWDKIPPNGTLFLSNPVNTRYRLVIAFTADFPREQVLNFIEFLIFINRRLYHRRLSIQCCYLLSTSEIGMFNVLFLRFPLPSSRWRNILTFHTILVICMVFQIIT